VLVLCHETMGQVFKNNGVCHQHLLSILECASFGGYSIKHKIPCAVLTLSHKTVRHFLTSFVATKGAQGGSRIGEVGHASPIVVGLDTSAAVLHYCLRRLRFLGSSLVAIVIHGSFKQD
jgi:hypothetical protein